MTLLFVAPFLDGGDKDEDEDGDGDGDAGDAFPDVAAHQKCRQENLFSLFHIFHSVHTWRSPSLRCLSLSLSQFGMVKEEEQ